MPRQVVEAMTDYLYHHNANTHWAYPTSEETDAALENAREILRDLLNASPREIAFGANMTTLTFHLARALGAAVWQGRRNRGDRTGSSCERRSLAAARAGTWSEGEDREDGP